MPADNRFAEIASEVGHLSGDLAEIGVYKGGTAKQIREAFATGHLHLFDTFSGMPESMYTPHMDGQKPGDFFVQSDEHCRIALAEYGQWTIHQGVFPDTAICRPFKFVHIDVDFYASTLAAVEWAWTHLVPGGVILDDDYGYARCRGSKVAIDEFCGKHDIKYEIVKQKAFIRKTCEWCHADTTEREGV